MPDAIPVNSADESGKNAEEIEGLTSVAPPEITPELGTKFSFQTDPSPQKKSASFRSIADSIQDLAGTVLFESGFSKEVLDMEELVEILRVLEDCREEGRELYPEILLTTNLSSALKPLHPFQQIICGECTDRPGRFRRALKRCAPIAGESWTIVLEVSKASLKYGLVSKNSRPYTESIHEIILDPEYNSGEFPILYLRRFGNRAILLKNRQEERVLSLTLSDELLRATDAITKFSKISTSDLPDSQQDNTCRIINRLLEHACREGHGLIACVISGSGPDIEKIKSSFPDGSWICPFLDLSPFSATDADAALTIESEGSLRARITLAKKMIEVDLMTMFSTQGKLIGYNIHIPASASEGVSGGARSRAFQSLEQHDALRAIFMCSQDGQTQFKDLSYGK